MPSRSITDAHPVLREAWPRILKQYKDYFPDLRLTIELSHMAPEEQHALYQQGRNGLGEITDETKVVTNIDGETRQSLHNRYPAEEIDVVVYDRVGLVSKLTAYYVPVAEIVRKMGLTFIEPNHIRLPLNKK